jgi:transcriptional regulator with XRE-family HTH domain
MEIVYTNKVPALLKARKMEWKTFRREAYIKTGLTEPTLAKAWRGDTDLTLESVAKLASFFGVSLGDVMETRVK